MISKSLLCCVIVICLTASFNMGYNIGVMNNITPTVEKFFNEKLIAKYNMTLSAQNLLAIINGIFVLAAALGAGVSGIIAQKFGRRNGLMINQVTAIIGSVLAIPTVASDEAWLIFVARFFNGVNSGIVIGVASMYLTEIAPTDYRGAIGACHQLAVTIGIMMSYLFTMDWCLNTDTLWPYAVALIGFNAILGLILMPIFPESPRFLFLGKKDEVNARKAYKIFNPDGDVEQFIAELREEVAYTSQQPAFHFTQLFTQKDLRMPVILACLIQVMQQLSGINAVMVYSSKMLDTAGISSNYNQICVLLLGIVNVVMTIVALPLLEKFGRRTLLLVPSAVLAFSLLFSCIFVNLSISTVAQATKSIYGGVSVGFLVLFIISFALGLGTIAGLVTAEIFRTEPKPSAYALTMAIQWLTNFIVQISFPAINTSLGGYTFLIFLVVVVVCWIFCFLFLPETKGKTFDEVATDLAFGNIVVGRKDRRIVDDPILIDGGKQDNAMDVLMDHLES